MESPQSSAMMWEDAITLIWIYVINHILLVCYAYLGKVLTTILLIEMWAMEI